MDHGRRAHRLHRRRRRAAITALPLSLRLRLLPRPARLADGARTVNARHRAARQPAEPGQPAKVTHTSRMINYRCERGHEIDVCADCVLEEQRREEWAEWEARWSAALGAPFVLGSTGTVHRRGSCVRVPEDTKTDAAFRDAHSPPLTWPLPEADAAILLLAGRGSRCKLCWPSLRPTNLRAFNA